MNDIYNLLIAILSALLIGAEREFSLKSLPDEERIAGIRTFALMGIIAALSGVLTLKVSVAFGILGFVAAIGIAIFSYLNSSNFTDKGLTTETSLIATYLSVYIISIGHIKIGVMSVVIIFALLSLKAKFRYFIDQLGEKDFYATLKFLILIAIIYPLLPDKMYFGIEILNPSGIFKIVIIIAGLSYLGYVSVRIVGAKKGLFISSLLGSIVSSTAVTINLSKYYKENRHFESVCRIGILSACTIMFIRVMVLVVIFNRELILPLLISFAPIVLFLGVVISFDYRKMSVKVREDQFELKNPVSISSALNFGFFLVAIILLAEVMKKYFGTKGVLALAAISGLSDVDAITVLLSKMALTSENSMQIYVLGVFIASIVNTFVKGFLAYYIGGTKFGVKLFLILSISSISGIALFILNSAYSLF